MTKEELIDTYGTTYFALQKVEYDPPLPYLFDVLIVTAEEFYDHMLSVHPEPFDGELPRDEVIKNITRKYNDILGQRLKAYEFHQKSAPDHSGKKRSLAIHDPTSPLAFWWMHDHMIKEVVNG